MWNPQRICRRTFLRLSAAGLGAALLPLPVPAQTPGKGKPVLIYFHDGFALQGYVKRETEEIVIDDFNGTPVGIPRGFFLIDDGPRRVTFAQTQVAWIARPHDYNDDVLVHDKKYSGVGLSKEVPSILEIVETSDWSPEWERTLRFRGRDKTPMQKVVDVKVDQHIGRMTPYSIRVDTVTKYLFSSAYLTREFSPDVIRGLVSSHPNIAENPGMAVKARLNRRYAYCQFMAQAGYFDLAEEDLLRTLKDFPEHKEEIEKRLKDVGTIKARETFDFVQRLALAGQHKAVAERIKSFPKKYADEPMLGKLRELEADYKTAQERGAEALKHLADLSKAAAGDNAAHFREAAAAMREEMCYDNVNRLDNFVEQAKQYQRLKGDGKKPPVGPEELMSLAVSSWLLGSVAGETKPETAARLWKLRRLILEYEKTDDRAARHKLIAAARLGDDLKVVEEAAQIVSSLPPSEPGEIFKGSQPMKAGRNTTYELQLPPEYRHGRHHPLLIVLHESGEKPLHMLERWQDAAADNGFLLAAPEWERKGSGYTYGDAEHQTVLDTIRDVRRHYRVDSDRVFLFGLRDGGLMALDVGMSHPDLFAGVSTMGAGPDKYSEVYWHNAQYLPFYVVNGDRVGPMLDKAHKLFESWVNKDFPALWVQYKGRGAEWFAGEVPMIFDWMRVKRRAFPLHQLAKTGNGDSRFGTDFFTLRTTDNAFYWLTTDYVMEQYCKTVNGPWTSANPASLQATIYPDSNDIRVTAIGVKQVSVWLGRNLKGEGMIDFSKPVSFRVSLGRTTQAIQVLNKKMVSPSLSVLLEDLYRRGDRQRVYMARLDWPAEK
jgi:pimeloyl-ACP methyl ester carboxylesterase